MRLMFASLVAGVAMSCASAAAQGVVWQAATEYPATTMPGQGLARFARLVDDGTHGAIRVTPRFDAPDGLRSRTIPAAVQSGRIAVGDAFAGALGLIDPLFELSSLPFLATSARQAQYFAKLARPAYEQVFAGLGQHLLYVTPWPPSGLWSRHAIDGPDDLKGLALRTYDAVGTAVLRGAGADANALSFADAAPQIAAGRLAAVLSSGDGGAGQKLWLNLPYFTEIGYAMPLSFATVSNAALQALDPALQRAVEQAGEATEIAQWEALNGRQAANYQTMRQNGVEIRAATPALSAALAQAAGPVIRDWEQHAGPAAAGILRAYREAKDRGATP